MVVLPLLFIELFENFDARVKVLAFDFSLTELESLLAILSFFLPTTFFMGESHVFDQVIMGLDATPE